ncbi:hypothetical protein DFR70_103130 [Nocardia tenerifensis]|uniref:Uncharacterized protein n=1 Tax=Nocardia tenerifensis TaxID=228006 RepID=A0A318K826_9NOCA|nr:hypothetical protein [Nocardia tenerifensis]PXX66382.1 hypothetical protein DFR70_103130 [Nocardia tenerifensis]
MTTVSRPGRRLLLAIAGRLLLAALATLATVVFSYLLLHPDSHADTPRAPHPPISTISPRP